MENKIKEYALKHYAKTFTKSRLESVTTARGSSMKRVYYSVEPIVVEYDTFWAVSNHKDASPIILSKNIKL